MSGKPGQGRGRAGSSHAPRRNAPPRDPEPTGFPARPNPVRIDAYAGLALLCVLLAMAAATFQPR
ncbi:hypothetical protein ACFXMR_28435, partial [Streptomyces griseus]